MREICFCDYINLDYDTSKQILAIRNLKHVREASKNTDKISLNSHINWIKNLKNNQYFAITIGNSVVGGVSLVNGLWGIFYKNDIDAILKLLCAFIFFENAFKTIDTIESNVKINNQNALNFNLFFGFRQIKKDSEFYHLALKKEDFLNLENSTIDLLKKIKKKYSIKWV